MMIVLFRPQRDGKMVSLLRPALVRHPFGGRSVRRASAYRQDLRASSMKRFELITGELQQSGLQFALDSRSPAPSSLWLARQMTWPLSPPSYGNRHKLHLQTINLGPPRNAQNGRICCGFRISHGTGYAAFSSEGSL